MYRICLGNEALGNVTNALNNSMPENIILKYKSEKYQMNLQELEVKFDVETAVNEAYNIGRTQNVVKDLWDYAKISNDTINIDSKLQYNEEKLNQCLAEIAEKLPDKVQEYTYRIEENKLMINSGKSGEELNHEELKNLILTNLQNRNYEEEIEIPTDETLPKPINLQAIHEKIFTEPQDAYYTENPMTIHNYGG